MSVISNITAIAEAAFTLGGVPFKVGNSKTNYLDYLFFTANSKIVC